MRVLPSFCNQTVFVVRPALTERRGTLVPDWERASRRELHGCSLQPAATATGTGEARVNAVGSSAVLYAPPGSDIRAGDRVECEGTAWSVDGQPFERTSPTGRASHVRVLLSEWNG